MSDKLIDSLAQGGILGLVLGLVVLYQGRKIDALSAGISELIGLLRERFKMVGLVVVLSLGTLLGGCGSVSKNVDVAVCYYVEGYGQVCLNYDGRFHFRADLSSKDIAIIKEKLEAQGVHVPDDPGVK